MKNPNGPSREDIECWQQELEDQEKPRKKHYIACHDRMCGAEDCPNCKPYNFKGGVYIDDLETSDE